VGLWFVCVGGGGKVGYLPNSFKGPTFSGGGTGGKSDGYLNDDLFILPVF